MPLITWCGYVLCMNIKSSAHILNWSSLHSVLTLGFSRFALLFFLLTILWKLSALLLLFFWLFLCCECRLLCFFFFCFYLAFVYVQYYIFTSTGGKTMWYLSCCVWVAGYMRIWYSLCVFHWISASASRVFVCWLAFFVFCFLNKFGLTSLDSQNQAQFWMRARLSECVYVDIILEREFACFISVQWLY